MASAVLQHRPAGARFAGLKAKAMASFAAFTRRELAVPAYPLEVFLEVSNLCNAQCVMCGVFSAFNPHRVENVRADQRGHMEMLQIDALLSDEELFSHAPHAHLYGFGEPTIHPRFQEIIRAGTGA